MVDTDRRDKFGWHPLDLRKPEKSPLSLLTTKLTHVVVPPYLRMEDGKVIQVAGYEYDRAGPGPLSSLRTATVTGPAPTSLLAKTDIEDQRKHGKQPIHLDADRFEAAATAAGIDISKVKSLKLRFRDLGKEQGVTQNLGGGNFRVVVGIKPKEAYEERHLYVVNNSLVHELRHVTQMQNGNKVQYKATKQEYEAEAPQEAKAGGYIKMEAEAQMFGRLAWHGDPAKKPLGPLGQDKEHMGKDLWAIAFDAEQSARGDVGYAAWEGDEPLNANFRTFTSPAKDRRNYVARITGGDMTTEKGVQREFLEDAWEKTGEQTLKGTAALGDVKLEKWQPRIPAQDGVYEVQFYHQDPNKQKSKDTKSRHHVIVKGGIARVEIDPDELQAALSADLPAAVFLARVFVAPYERMDDGRLVHVESYIRDITPSASAIARLGTLLAKRKGTEAESIQEKRITKKVRAALDRPQVRVRISMSTETLDKVLDRGRYIPSAEEQHPGGPARTTTDIEKVAQHEVFGDIPERPVYGFLSEGAAWNGPGGIGQGVEVVLKPEAKHRSFVFFGDSVIGRGFDPEKGRPILPMAHDEADHRVTAGGGTVGGVSVSNTTDWRSVDEVSPYVEAQVFGGVSIDDIERVVLPSLATERQLEDIFTLQGPEGRAEEARRNIANVASRRRLTELGIPWEEG